MPISDLLAQITGEPSPTLPPTSNFVPKRKADGELPKPADKMQRISSSAQPANSSRPISQPRKPSAASSAPNSVKQASKTPVPRPTASFKNGQPTPPPTTDRISAAQASAPPKKGSFAEIMARGKVAQQTLGQIGKIQHKKIEKVTSRREREEMKNQKMQNMQKNLGPNGKFKSANSVGNGRVVEKQKAKSEPVSEKKMKKAATATTGYAGTARPKPGSSKLASKPCGLANSRGSDRYGNERASSSHRYTYASSEEEEDDDDEPEYDSDASSDMEAAAFEVDEEEEEAARIARREDAEALAEENRLKREKAEKKKRLAALAKGRR